MISRVPLSGRRVRLVLLAAVLVATVGCAPGDVESLAATVLEPISGAGFGDSSLRIVTCWARSDREEIEREFRDSPDASKSDRLIWIELPEGMPLARMGNHLPAVDVFLGGPLTEYERLAREGKLEALKEGDSNYWRVARRSVIDVTMTAGQQADRACLEDPRVSPVTFAWAVGMLRTSAWQAGYARLLRDFGHSMHRSGWLAGGSLAATQREQGWSLVATRLAQDTPLDSGSIVYAEGAAIVRGTRHAVSARSFLAFLASRQSIVGGPSREQVDPEAADLLADLLGATLVDAQDELRTTWELMDRSGSGVPAQALRWLSEPPPWPPASIEKLQNRGGDRAIAMVHDLAGQIAPDPGLRFWLIQSWLKPRRLFDQSLVVELSRAEQGRLVREPRFRAWLRGEWTAWARQRYRRVARLVELAPTPLAGGPPSRASM